jgi:hypothetical protein
LFAAANSGFQIRFCAFHDQHIDGQSGKFGR